MVWHGEAWCGADQAKKQAPHLKTGPPLCQHSPTETMHSRKQSAHWPVDITAEEVPC